MASSPISTPLSLQPSQETPPSSQAALDQTLMAQKGSTPKPRSLHVAARKQGGSFLDAINPNLASSEVNTPPTSAPRISRHTDGGYDFPDSDPDEEKEPLRNRFPLSKSLSPPVAINSSRLRTSGKQRPKKSYLHFRPKKFLHSPSKRKRGIEKSSHQTESFSVTDPKKQRSSPPKDDTATSKGPRAEAQSPPNNSFQGRGEKTHTGPSETVCSNEFDRDSEPDLTLPTVLDDSDISERRSPPTKSNFQGTERPFGNVLGSIQQKPLTGETEDTVSHIDEDVEASRNLSRHFACYIIVIFELTEH